MKKEKDKISIHKIDMDNQQEPIIVPVSEREMINSLDEKVDSKIIEKYEEKPSIGSQMDMKNLFAEDKAIEKRQRILKIILTWLFVAIVVSVLAYTFYSDFFKGGEEKSSWTEILPVLKGKWFYGILALISLFLLYFNKGLKLSILSKKITGKWNLKACMGTAVVGIYYNYVTPLAVGGQPFEIYHLSKNGVTGGASVCLPVATYFLHQISFAILAIASLILFSADAFNVTENFSNLSGSIEILIACAWVGIAMGVLMPITILLFCLMPKATSKIVAFIIKLGGKLKIVKNVQNSIDKTVKNLTQNANCFKTILKAPLCFISDFLLSFCEHLALSSIAYFTLKLFGFDIEPNPNGILEWLSVMEISFIIYAAVSFIPTPGNAGAADLSFYALFKASITIAGMSFTAMIFWRILSYYSLLLIGIIYLTGRRKIEKKLNKVQE